ncbi:MAG: CocE/NonD family hydrolase [Gemmatimonadota bacterium]
MILRRLLGCVVLLPLLAEAQASVATPGVMDRDVAVVMRDGVTLRADLWRPEGSGPFPTLVYRTPYGKQRLFETSSTFRAAVERGYAVVAQDVRGRYTSQGRFLPYQQEGSDGYDTIEWAAAQPWSNGRVGTFGLSYPGAVQWLAAMERPPHLVAMVPAMTFATPNHFWYTGGVWDHSWLSWVWFNIAPDLRSRAGTAGPRTGREAADAWEREGLVMQNWLPLMGMPAFRGIADWYYDWMRHPPWDTWWEWAELGGKYGRVEAAVLNLSGWHDEAYGPAGAIMNFNGLVAARGGDARRGRTQLIVGPWNHGVGPISRTVIGDRDMGTAATINYDSLVLNWMDRWVRQLNNGVDSQPPVRAFVMGSGNWRSGNTWPLMGRRDTLFLAGPASPGRAGSLMNAAPQRGDSATLVSDPRDPVRDQYADEQGAHDYRALSQRADVLVFETAPLANDLDVVGSITASVHLSVDAPDTDLWVKLLDVAPDGTALSLMNPGPDVVRASYRSRGRRELLESGRIYDITIPTLLTGNRFLRGHRIRIVLMTSFAPHMSRNLHTGLLETESAETRTATLTILMGGRWPSRIELPVLTR